LKIGVSVVVPTGIKEEFGKMKDINAHFVYQFPPFLYFKNYYFFVIRTYSGKYTVADLVFLFCS
jgi:hypothetical protein